MCHVVQSEVERIFKARSAARWNPGQRKGKLHRGALHRIPMNDDRVFRTKIEATNKDIAVQLVIDCSGSMSGSKISSAATAAYMLASIFERINVPFEVVGFTTLNAPIAGHVAKADWTKLQKDYQACREEAYRMGKRTKFARFAPIALYTFKEFQKRFDDIAKKTLGFLPNAYGFMLNNIDGESIEMAAMRLRMRREARKVMIVMSDGQPAGDGDGAMQQRKLKQVVEDIGRSNIEIYGLGLEDRSVLHYYPKAEVIGHSAQIPEKVMALIQRLLTA
jgi:cobalamin biosynthesis protein CobT